MFFPNLDFFIYNWWGQKVFESHDVDQGWDGTFNGKDLNAEVFVYYIKATSRQGDPEDPEDREEEP